MSVDQRGVECVDKRVDRGVCAVDPSGSGSRVDIAHIVFSIYPKSGCASTMRVGMSVDQLGGAPTSTSRCAGAMVGESYKCVRL